MKEGFSRLKSGITEPRSGSINNREINTQKINPGGVSSVGYK
jgi:hypothetical protein